MARILLDLDLSGGSHSVVWDGKDERGRAMPPGPYFYQLTSGGRSQSKRMVMLR